MISTIRNFVALTALVLLTACGGGTKQPVSKFRSYNGPPVTQIVVEKGDRQMFLLSGSTVLKAYDIGLGFQPIGHKMYEGDGRTPEGIYYINRQNPNSAYHLSLGISYPDPTDKARAMMLGQQPGGDIMIHGRGPNGNKATARDWTAGCIAVNDREIEEIFSMVRPGVPVVIYP